MYLQVSGDGVVGSMGDHEDAVGLADHTVTHLYLPCMPVGDACPHDGHAQLGVVGVVQLPVQEGGGGGGVTECSESNFCETGTSNQEQ